MSFGSLAATMLSGLGGSKKCCLIEFVRGRGEEKGV